MTDHMNYLGLTDDEDELELEEEEVIQIEDVILKTPPRQTVEISQRNQQTVLPPLADPKDTQRPRAKRDKSAYKPFLADDRTPRCQATSKATQKQCMRSAKLPYRVCVMHGVGKGDNIPGPAPQPEKPRSRHNPAAHAQLARPPRGYAAAMPAHMRDAFQRNLVDPEMMNMTQELALVSTRIEKKLSQLDDSMPLREVHSSYEALIASLEAGDTAAVKKHLNTMGKALKSELGQRESWREIVDLTRTKGTLVDQTRRHQHEERLFVTLEDYHAQTLWFQQLILQYVLDPEAKKRIVTDIRIRQQQLQQPV